ncbi:MAG: glycosyltransferase family 4 protein [Candidatus Omnitrophica bacterium]|nr:glycosyltransferase family 4 protein [Candidatus Omnitrophota bacterium]MCF7877989.1 glycosyltransferase family 4 protein [Candidatus Omnitrophota bacterium]MCF7892919.1 glycosyltransferase family 4 protein [Candidatus Omnitrophota bacterium]
MRVLQVLPHLNIGGITTYVYTLAKYLLKNDIEVAVCSAGGNQEHRFKQLGIKTYRIPIKTKNELSPKVAASALRLSQIHKQFSYDLLHSHTRVTQVASQLTSLFTKIPHIANFHGFYKKNKTRKIRKIIKAHGKYSIAITPLVKNDLINYFGANPKKIKTILSGIDLETLNQKTPPLQLKGDPIVGASGRLSPVKGFQYLIRSIPKVLEKYPEAKFYILGEGNYQNYLLNLADKLKVINSIVLLKRKSLSAFLNSLDIFCLPSLEEPLGLSVVEAQYLGIPPVVSKVDGLNLLVGQEKTGLKVPPANSLAIAEAIIKLKADKTLYQKISEKSRKQVIDKFDITKKIDSFIKVYEKAVKNTSS